MNSRSIMLILAVVLLSACGPAETVFPSTATLAGIPPTSAPAMPVQPAAIPSLTPINTAAVPAGLPAATLPAVLPSNPPIVATLPAATASTLRGPYAIINIATNDKLNIRSGPGVKFPIVEQLLAESNQIYSTGQAQEVAKNRWVEVKLLSGAGMGWVNAVYLTEYVDPQAFCTDTRVPSLFDQVGQALNDQNGEALAALVSPVHGLDVTYFRTGQTANYTSDEARFLFSSQYQMNWGTQPASGLQVKGTFHEQVLPQLVEVMGSPHERICNQPRLGGASYAYTWPAEYRYINFYSLYKPSPAGQELAWRTWLAGIEYFNGQPYLFSLIHLFWEP